MHPKILHSGLNVSSVVDSVCLNVLYLHMCVCKGERREINAYLCACVSLSVISALIRPGSLQGGLHLLNISFPGH